MAGLRVVVEPGTGYELLLSATAIADRTAPRRVDLARELRRRARAIDGGATRKTFEQIGREPFVNLLGFVHAMTEEPTAANAVRAIASAQPREVVLAAAGYSRRAFRIATSPSIIRDAVDGDAAAIRAFQRTSYPHLDHWQASLRHILAVGAEQAHEEIARSLDRWLADVFVELEPEFAEVQRSSAIEAREMLAKRDLESVLDRVAPGMTFTREVGQEVVVLTPSVIARPAFALSDYGPTLVIAYSAPTQSEDSDRPPERLVLIAKAMGDDLRLRALRELRDGPMSATELARRLGVPRTSIHHHLNLLLSAGLARMAVDDARTGNIELRAAGVAELARLAEGWLET